MKPFIAITGWNGKNGQASRYNEVTLPIESILWVATERVNTASKSPSAACHIVMADDWRFSWGTVIRTPHTFEEIISRIMNAS